MTHNPEGLALLREKAKTLGIANYAVTGYENLYTKVMAKQDEIDAAEKVKELAIRTETEAAALKIKKEQDKDAAAGRAVGEKFYFTDPKSNKIGEYIQTNKKNLTPYNEKKTSFVFQRWM